MTRSEFIADNAIEGVLASRGIEISKGKGPSRMAKCPLHADKTPSFSVDVDKQLWTCYAGCGGGSVIDLLAKLEGLTPLNYMKRENINSDDYIPVSAVSTPKNDKNGVARPTERPAAIPAMPVEDEKLDFKVVETYDYRDQFGELVYRVARKHAESKKSEKGYKKTFRQKQPDGKGGWIYNMDGVERVLYRLPEILKAKAIWIVEGEKDANNLVKLGFEATCNVGGAGKWLDGYTPYLKGKNLILCGDNDEPGHDHISAVFESVKAVAKTIKKIKLPDSVKDVSDFILTFETSDVAKQALSEMSADCIPFIKGVSVPIRQISELEERYKNFVQKIEQESFKLSKWIPSMGVIRPLVAGQLVLFIGSTGIGKTSILSNIADQVKPLPTVFFELELPDEDMFERFMAMKMKMSGAAVEDAYRKGEEVGEESINLTYGHVFITTRSRYTVAEIEQVVTQSSLKIGSRPKVVLIDYAGLVQGHGKGRYEKQSSVAEDLKVMAKNTQTIVIVSGQVARNKDAETPEIGLNDARDSGSWEQSAQLVIGAWRDAKDPTLLTMKVLKATKGGAGTQVRCNYNLSSLLITERSKIDDGDISAAEDFRSRSTTNLPELEKQLELSAPRDGEFTQPPDEN